MAKKQQMIKVGRFEYTLDEALAMTTNGKILINNLNGYSKALELLDSGCYLSVSRFGPNEFIKPNDDTFFGFADPDLAMRLATYAGLIRCFLQTPNCEVMAVLRSPYMQIDSDWIRTEEQFNATHAKYPDDDEDEDEDDDSPTWSKKQ